MKAKDLAVFKVVAGVIGNDNAKVELDKVIKHDGCFVLSEEASVWGAFAWEDSPQGHEFWSDIACKVP
ncbi:conserved hypothetical protein [Vibrio phage 199E37-1]|nr:conserved hypothetical protein [Vibrio phage 199E37-1]